MNNTSKIQALLQPKSIAIVGASANLSSMGGRLLKYLPMHGYKGDIYPVNPKYEEINNFTCFPSIMDLPKTPDTAIIIVSSQFVIDILKQCSKKGIPSATIISSGYAETGAEGRRKQMELKKFASANGIRICGPNCLGYINTHDNIAASLAGRLGYSKMIKGGIAIISHSGALSSSILSRSQDRGIGLSYLISTGNEADLETVDYIEYLVEDPNTKAIACLIEGFKDGAKFIRATELAFKKKKPIIVLKLGRSSVGERAAASHTGSLTGSDDICDALFRQKGIIRVDDIDELFVIPHVLINSRIPEGRRIGILTTTGGAGVLLADKCIEGGLDVPTASDVTQCALKEIIPPYGCWTNPVDITAQVLNVKELFFKAVDVFLKDEMIDLIVVICTAAEKIEDRARTLAQVFEQTNKPILFLLPMAKERIEKVNEVLADTKIPVFDTSDECLKGIKALYKYGTLLRDLEFQEKQPEENNRICLHSKKSNRFLNKRSGSLTERESKLLLSNYGIPTTQEFLATTIEEAIQFAYQISFPVALKVESPDITHKSDINALKLNIFSENELVAAYDEIMENVKRYKPSSKIQGILVQEMVPKGTEVIIGMTQDVQFGPTIMFGLGGVFVEVLKDVSFRVAPLRVKDAEEMVKEIKGFKILEGVRGEPKSDTSAIIDILLRMSSLSIDLKDYISEVDINPIVVFKEGDGAKAVDALFILK